MEKKKNIELKNMLIGFGVIFLYLISSLFSSILLSVFNINYSNMSTTLKAMYNIGCELALTLIIIYIYKKDFIPNLKDFIKNSINYFKKYIKYWFLILILMMSSNAIITAFTTTQVAENQTTIVETFKNFPIYTFILTVFVAPVLEELVFRLSFRKIFAHTDILFIFFSGFIFGGMHVIGSLENIVDLLFIIPYSIPGFIFAYIYAKSKNICIPIGLHFIHNGIMMGLQILLLIMP